MNGFDKYGEIIFVISLLFEYDVIGFCFVDFWVDLIVLFVFVIKGDF